MGESDQRLGLIIPQAQRQTFQAGAEGDGRDGSEDGVGVVAALQVVVGDARIQVMNMVETDIA